jgi:thymidylate synthase (FAD)
MVRDTNPTADALQDKAFCVLHGGFTSLVDYLGSDARIVQTARVSYGASTRWPKRLEGLVLEA